MTGSDKTAASKTGKHFILDNPILSTLLLELVFMCLVNILAIIIMIPAAIVSHPAGGDIPAGLESAVSTLATCLGALIIALLVKWRLGKTFVIGFTGKNLGKSLMFCIPVIILSVACFIRTILTGEETFAPTAAILTAALMQAFMAGFNEEVLFRGLYCNNMMRRWKNNVYLPVAASAVFFGLVHFSSGFFTGVGVTGRVVIQVVHAVALGLVFGAVYVRTKNLIGPIIVHTFWDFAIFVFSDNENMIAEAGKNLAGGIDMEFLLDNGLSTAVALVVAFVLLRPSKHDEIRALWEDTEEN